MPLTKATFRQNCLNRMKTISKCNSLYRNMKIDRAINSQLKDVRGKKILVYSSLEFEADISKIVKKLRKKNNLYLPFMQGESFKMVPFRLPLSKKKFGIYEAGNSLRNIKKIDIAIVPIVGVDGNLRRVGFGKGMYDRFFAKLKKRPYIIFIQPIFCYTKELICDDYDITCDLVITPKIKIKKREYGYCQVGK